MGKWPMVRLGDVFYLQMGKTPSRDNNMYWDNGVHNWASISDLSSAGKYIETTREKITDSAVKETGIKIVPENTVLLSFKLSLGKVCISSKSLYTNEAIMALLDKKVFSINIDYIYYTLKHTNWDIYTNKAAKGKTLNKTTLANIKIPLPPPDIQKHIANILDKAQEIIDGYKQQLVELDNLIKAVFYEMFQKYFINKKTYKKLQDICTFIDYRGKTPEKSDSGIPLITAKNIKNNTFSVEPREYIPEENYNKVMTRGIPKPNDVIFTTEAPLGNVCRIPKYFSKFAVGQRIIVMQPKKGLVTSEYLEYALSSEPFQKEMFKRSSGSTVRGIRSKELLQLAICIPPIQLQKDFSKIVTKIEEQKALVKQSIAESEHLFNSLMSEYFD